MIVLASLGSLSCRPLQDPEKTEPAAKSTKSFDEICDLVAGKTAAEVEVLLGPPDNVYPSPLGNERWTWWNYTFLDGNSYPPEIRKRVVHLEIVFENPGLLSGQVVPASQWRVSDELSVSYQIPDSRI